MQWSPGKWRETFHLITHRLIANPHPADTASHSSHGQRILEGNTQQCGSWSGLPRIRIWNPSRAGGGRYSWLALAIPRSGDRSSRQRVVPAAVTYFRGLLAGTRQLWQSRNQCIWNYRGLVSKQYHILGMEVIDRTFNLGNQTITGGGGRY